MEIPQDITSKIEELFTDNDTCLQAKELISKIWEQDINVGHAQLARSIVVISNGDLEKIREILDSNFHNDPRDIIMEAEQKTGNPGHYFISSF